MTLLHAACDDIAVHECRLWAQSIAPPGTHALASCNHASAAGVICGFGDLCVATVPGMPARCTCGGATCAPSELCVTDETDLTLEAGPPTPHCVRACWPMPDP